MNRKNLYAILPSPDEILIGEYQAIHNTLMDAVNEWTTNENEDISVFARSVLVELREWASFLINRLDRACDKS